MILFGKTVLVNLNFKASDRQGPLVRICEANSASDNLVNNTLNGTSESSGAWYSTAEVEATSGWSPDGWLDEADTETSGAATESPSPLSWSGVTELPTTSSQSGRRAIRGIDGSSGGLARSINDSLERALLT